MELSAAVMSHPSRAEAAEALLARLAPLQPSLALDPDPDGPPSALAASLLAWGRARPDATHHLVVQDDAELAADAVARIQDAIVARPDAVLVHYVGWASASAQLVRASGALPDWGEIADPYLPAVCVSMPADLARWIAARPASSPLDDVNLRHAIAEAGRPLWARYPSPADHGQLPSLVGNDRQGRRGAITRGWRTGVSAEATTAAVRAFPVIDRRGGDGELLLRWLERTTQGAWRVRSVGDALRAEGADVAQLVRTAAERAARLRHRAETAPPVRELALLWLACWGTAVEGRRSSHRAGAVFDDGVARLNVEHAMAEWTERQPEAWMTDLVDDAVRAARHAAAAVSR